MSYASVTAKHTLPPSQQPHPDPALLNTTSQADRVGFDDNSKVNVIPSDAKLDRVTSTSDHEFFNNNADNGRSPSSRKKPNKHLQEVEAEGLYLWKILKHRLLQPGVAGGLVGIINIGLLAGAGCMFYAETPLRRNRNTLASAVATSIALLSFEGYAIEKYRKTSSDVRRAKNDDTSLHKDLYEQIFRPGVLGGFIGLFNSVVLGAVGYICYVNWDKPTWNRRTISAATIGLLSIWGGEGFLAKRYRKN